MEQPEYGAAIISSEDVTALEAQERAQLDVQIATAKRYPRSVAKFQENAQSLATISEEVAASCYYTIPRAGKEITGPSVRLAEIVMSEWGNAHAGARVIEVGQKTLTAQAVFRDLEKNTAVSMEVTVKILDSRGNRYSEDMITVTSNAACKKAFRNAVFSGVPRSFWMEVYEAARTASIGEASNLDEAKAKILQYFGPMGKREPDIIGLLGKESMDDVTKDDLIFMRGVATAIREQEVSLEEAFNPAPEDDAPRTTVTPDDIGSSAKKNGKESEPNPTKEDAPPDASEPDPEPTPGATDERPTPDTGESEDDSAPEEDVSESTDTNRQPEPEKPKKEIRAATKDQIVELNELAWKAGMRPSELTEWTNEHFGAAPDRLDRETIATAIRKLGERATA